MPDGDGTRAESVKPPLGLRSRIPGPRSKAERKYVTPHFVDPHQFMRLKKKERKHRDRRKRTGRNRRKHRHGDRDNSNSVSESNRKGNSNRDSKSDNNSYN